MMIDMNREFVVNALDLELKAMEFTMRTGLAPKDCTIVHYCGKKFIQWAGAAAAIPAMPEIGVDD